MGLTAGRMLAHYRLVEQIGEGGMGVVWKALDTTLDREVAIKILPDVFAQDPDRLARFEREAKVLASLNHPNIAAVYSVHDVDDLRFLAMELVPGEDLSQRLERGPLTTDDALGIALQVSEALEAAHDSGVVHRDLKPANVQLTPDGKVKVLDFGLAKALESGPVSTDRNPAMSPTLTSAGSVAGVVLGTAAYMSPEQAHGRPVDRRADVWAFGCLLYEMLTSRPAFRGESISDTLASVLKLEPDWEELYAVPPRTAFVLRRCLVKDPLRRLQAIGEARIAIGDELAGTALQGAAEQVGLRPVDRPSSFRRIAPWAAAALLAVALGISLWIGRSSPPEPAQPVRVKFRVGSGRPMGDGLGAAVVLSPDGRRMAYVSESGSAAALWVRNLDALDPRELSGTLGASGAFFSPDGESIGFFAGGHLKKVPATGGAVEVLAVARSSRGGTWCADGSIVYSADVRSGLYVLRAGTSEPEVLTRTDPENNERSHRWPQCLPDGRSVIFGVQAVGEDYDDGNIDVVRLDDGTRTTVHRGGAYPRVVADRYLVFARKGTLYAAPFDTRRATLRGRPRPVIEDLMSRTGNQAAGDGSAQFDVSRDGVLVYRAGWQAANVFPMVWVDRDGGSTPAFDQEATYSDPRISPDGRKIAVTVIDGRRNDIWVLDLERGTFTRLTFGNASHYFPVWTRDSRFVAFSRDLGGSTGIYMKRADGSGAETQLFQASGAADEDSQRIALANPCSWAPDGRTLSIHQMTDDGGWDLAAVKIEDDGAATEQPLLATPYDEIFGEFSPDGRLIAYQSNESGGWQVYVRPFPDTGGRWQISIDGGQTPRWSRDGQELFFRSGSSVMAVAVERRNGDIHFEKPRRLFAGDFLDLDPFSSYDVSPDGQRFVMFPGTSGTDDPSEAILVFHWLEELRRQGD